MFQLSSHSVWMMQGEKRHHRKTRQRKRQQSPPNPQPQGQKHRPTPKVKTNPSQRPNQNRKNQRHQAEDWNRVWIVNLKQVLLPKLLHSSAVYQSSKSRALAQVAGLQNKTLRSSSLSQKQHQQRPQQVSQCIRIPLQAQCGRPLPTALLSLSIKTLTTLSLELSRSRKCLSYDKL